MPRTHWTPQFHWHLLGWVICGLGKTWVGAYMKLEEDDPAINCFRVLGEGPIWSVRVNGELPTQVEGLEQFICCVYCSAGPTIRRALRWEMVHSKNLQGEMVPPTHAALPPHITRANYFAMRDKLHTTNWPALPPIEENDWNVKEGVYVPVRCLILPTPRAVIELTKCACKSWCKGRCRCFKNRLPCTSLCKCHGSDCGNIIKDDTHEDDDEDDE